MSKKKGFPISKNTKLSIKIIEMRYRGMSYREISKILKIPEKVVLHIYENVH